MIGSFGQAVPTASKCPADARVVLADDHPVVLGGVRALLRTEPKQVCPGWPTDASCDSVV
jgi:hypothetical protein